MRAFGLVAFVTLAACGGSNSGTKSDAKIDSPRDTSMIDAPPDAPPDSSPKPDAAAGHYQYVIDHENVPTTSTQARAYGLDLNSDGTVDNQLGMVFATLQGMGFTVQATVSQSIDTGSTLMLVDLDTSDFQNAAATTYTMLYGANPQPPACNGSADTTCRHHLAGNASFDIAADSPHDTPLAGSAVSGTFNDGPGHLGIQVAMLTSGPPIPFHMIGARTKLTGVSASGITAGIVAGAIPETELSATVYPALATNMASIIERDCCGLATSPGGTTCNPNATPACGCTSGSSGATVIGLFDTSPKDCKVTVTEISNNSLIQALFAPDVTIDGMQALSFGVQVTAVPAHF